MHRCLVPTSFLLRLLYSNVLRLYTTHRSSCVGHASQSLDIHWSSSMPGGIHYRSAWSHCQSQTYWLFAIGIPTHIFLHNRFDLFVLLVQTRARDAVTEVAAKRVLISGMKFDQFRHVHHSPLHQPDIHVILAIFSDKKQGTISVSKITIV